MTLSLERHPLFPHVWRIQADTKPLSEFTDYATARRLMACWRACEGISTEDLEQLALAKTLDKKLKTL